MSQNVPSVNTNGLSTVRRNLLTDPGYAPYCGGHKPAWQMPRTRFDGSQFVCTCGWRSSFEPDFIEQVKVVRNGK